MNDTSGTPTPEAHGAGGSTGSGGGPAGAGGGPGAAGGGSGTAGSGGAYDPAAPGGLTENQAGALAYLFGVITGVIMLIIDRRPYVRFHAFQCVALTVVGIGLSIVLSILSAALSVVPLLGVLVGALASIVLGIAGLILWILLMVKAYQGERWELPWVGPWARKNAGT